MELMTVPCCIITFGTYNKRALAELFYFISDLSLLLLRKLKLEEAHWEKTTTLFLIAFQIALTKRLMICNFLIM